MCISGGLQPKTDRMCVISKRVMHLSGPTVAFASFQIHTVTQLILTVQQARSVSHSERIHAEITAQKKKSCVESISHAESFSSSLHYIVFYYVCARKQSNLFTVERMPPLMPFISIFYCCYCD